MAKWGVIKRALDEEREDDLAANTRQLTQAIRKSLAEPENVDSEPSWKGDGLDSVSWKGVQRRARRVSVISRLDGSRMPGITPEPISALQMNGCGFLSIPANGEASSPNHLPPQRKRRAARSTIRACIHSGARSFKIRTGSFKKKDERLPWYMIDPAKSFWIKPLDAMGFFALTFTALITP